MRRLVSNGFFCAKAPLQPWFCQRHCVSLCKDTKLQNSAFAEFWDSMPVSCFCRLCNQVLPKKLRFSLQRHKSSRILQSRILGEFAGFLLLPPLQSGFAKETAFFFAKAQKLQNSAKPNSGDCLPVSALECFSAYGTGNLFPNSAQAEFGGFGSRLLAK